ncbi:MAG: glycosyltransferase family 4 protein, partial [Cyanobacteria bacterium REEB65]|nr:glycosyltransferase family 4 protein [Cyanobacteria bacterium REEB65]
ISNGIDLQIYCPPSSEAERQALKRRFGLPLETPTVLYCGRFSDEKRLDVLLDAIPMALDRQTAHFAFVGTGSIDIQAAIAQRGLESRASVLGLLDDQNMPLVYRAADVFVLPSEAELQGLVLLEAAASGLPLVGANTLAIPEIIHHGVNGYLHVPGDSADLAERIADLVQDTQLRAQMGAKSLELVAKHSIPESIRQYEEIYRAAITACTAARA